MIGISSAPFHGSAHHRFVALTLPAPKKMIDVEIEHLEQLKRRAKSNPSEGPVKMDLSLRYLVTTSRELERRVDW
jgi:hypothetical protein